MITRVSGSLLILFFLLIACQENKSSLFPNLSKNFGSAKFTKVSNGERIEYDGTILEEYKFRIFEDKFISGYFYEEDSTIYFINSRLNDDSCLVLYPIINNNSKELVEPKSKCDFIPIIGERKYYIEVIDEQESFIKVKHSLYPTGQFSSPPDIDYCIFTFSRDKGILDFEYFEKENSYAIPWTYGGSR